MATHAHDTSSTPSTSHDNNDVVSSIYAMSFPALNGECVKQGHSDYCAAHGHAYHVVDGVEQGWCPRCGKSNGLAPAQVTPSTSTDVERATAIHDAIVDHVARARMWQGGPAAYPCAARLSVRMVQVGDVVVTSAGTRMVQGVRDGMVQLDDTLGLRRIDGGQLDIFVPAADIVDYIVNN